MLSNVHCFWCIVVPSLSLYGFLFLKHLPTRSVCLATICWTRQESGSETFARIRLSTVSLTFFFWFIFLALMWVMPSRLLWWFQFAKRKQLVCLVYTDYWTLYSNTFNYINVLRCKTRKKNSDWPQGSLQRGRSESDDWPVHTRFKDKLNSWHPFPSTTRWVNLLASLYVDSV